MLCDCARKQIAIARRQVRETEVQGEIVRFDAAVSAAAKKLLEVQESVRRSLGKDEAEILRASMIPTSASGPPICTMWADASRITLKRMDGRMFLSFTRAASLSPTSCWRLSLLSWKVTACVP